MSIPACMRPMQKTLENKPKMRIVSLDTSDTCAGPNSPSICEHFTMSFLITPQLEQQAISLLLTDTLWNGKLG